MSSERNSAPFVHGSSRLRTTWQTIVAIIGFTVVAVMAWSATNAKVEQNSRDNAAQDRRLEAIDAKFDALQREILAELRARADRRAP